MCGVIVIFRKGLRNVPNNTLMRQYYSQSILLAGFIIDLPAVVSYAQEMLKRDQTAPLVRNYLVLMKNTSLYFLKEEPISGLFWHCCGVVFC